MDMRVYVYICSYKHTHIYIALSVFLVYTYISRDMHICAYLFIGLSLSVYPSIYLSLGIDGWMDRW